MAQQARSRPDASMSLLNDLFARPLDPGYREAAERRAARGDTSKSRDPRLRFSASMVFGMVALGLLLTLGALQVRDSATVVTQERESLIDKVRSENDYVDGLNEQLAALDRQVSDIESDILQDTAVGQALRTELAKAESFVGSVPVEGSGVVVTLDDADDLTGEPRELVLAVDLQVVVNGLWAAGAEAVAVNEQRITPFTSIQGVDRVPQVNQQPVAPPYDVKAIGDADTLARKFSDGPAGAWLSVMSSAGPTSDIRTSGDLELPATSNTLIHAEPLEDS